MKNKTENIMASQGVASGKDARQTSVGGLSAGLSPWKRALLGADFSVLEGGNALSADIGGRRVEKISGFLDDESGRRFIALAGPLSGDEPVSGLFTTVDGMVVEAMAVRREDGDLELFFRRMDRLERAIEQLEIFYRNYVTTPMAICFTDPQGSIIDANASFLDLYGYTLEEVVGQNPRILKSGRQSPESYRELWMSISDETVGHWTGEVINRKKSGEEVYVLLSIASVRRADGNLIGYVASTIDISKRKTAEAEVAARNAELERLNQLKSDLMAITSHDLKAPLNAILNYAGVIEESGEEIDPDILKNYIIKIREHGQRMTSFINDILDLSKIESGKLTLCPARIRLDTVLKACIETNEVTARRKGVRITSMVKGVPGTVVADQIKMEQVFNNLLSNAVKFSPEGGRIDVSYSDYRKGKVRVTITDQGPGIPTEHLASIFDKFFQVQTKGHTPKRGFGVGLGLNVVKGIVELHNGKVWAENAETGGARFIVELPYKPVRMLIESLAAVVIDPGASIFGYIELPLKAKGVQIFMVKDLNETMRVLEYERPDIVFAGLDIVTEELAAYLSHAKKSGAAPVVVGVHGEEIKECPTLLDDLLVTPVMDVEIYDILERFFGS